MGEPNQRYPDGERTGEPDGRVGLLVDHDENGRRLATWLREETPYSAFALDTDDPAPRGELCIVDRGALRRAHDWLADAKEQENPRIYPVLLLRRDPERSLDGSLWDVIDETISMPVQIPELRRRLESLLERRHLSRDLSDRLDRTEERYRTVFEAVNDGILILNPVADTIVDCNPRAAALLGYSQSELRTVSPRETLHAEHQDRYDEFIRQLRDDGQARTAGLTCVRSDGSRLEVEVSGSVLADGPDPRLVFSIRDVTEQREQERTIESQRDRLAELNRVTRTLYETIRTVVQASTREELEREVCNRLADSDSYKFAWIGTGRADEEIVARAASRDANRYLDRVRVTVDRTPTGRGPTGQALRTGDVVTVQDVMTDSSMSPWRESLAAFDVRATAAVPISDGEQTFGVLNLYTSRQDAFTGEEQEILDRLGRTIGLAISSMRAHEEVRLFRQAVERSGHAMYITETDGTITYVNPAFEEITGYGSNDAVGETPQILSSSEHDPEFYRNLWDTILSGEIWQSQMVNRRKDGRRLYIDQTIAPIVDESGTIDHFIAVSKDITQTRRRQQQLQVLYRVLRHNLRNQLNIVQGGADLLTDVIDERESRDAVESITRAVDNLLRISEQARRIEGTFGSDISSRGDRCLSEVIWGALSEVDTDPIADISVSTPETEYRVDAELGTALTELLRNAVTHNDSSRPDVSIVAESTTVDDTPWVDVRVVDNGSGIPENERRTLQKGEETPLLHGEGLGLWLVNWVVTELGGDIDIRDNDPSGSIVALYVPATEGNEHE